MLGDVRLTAAGGFDKLRDVPFPLHEGAKQPQAHRLGQGAESVRYKFQRSIRELPGSGRAIGWGFFRHGFLWHLTLYRHLVIWQHTSQKLFIPNSLTQMKNDDCILPHELATALQAGGCQLIDVREPVEHAESHVSGARLIPLGQIEARCGELDKSKPIMVMCHAGKRGAAAVEKLRSLGFSKVRNLEGGILAWKSAGFPCAAGSKAVMPLMRQVQITVGFLVLLASLLSVFVDPRWVYLCMFFGAGLIFAGLSGFCGLAMILAKMPWNRVDGPSCAKTSCCS